MPVCQSRIDPLHDKAFTVITWGHLAVVFGTAYGGVTPLFAVLAREYFGQLAMRAVLKRQAYGGRQIFCCGQSW
jgi:hypothetical protein